MLIAIKKCGEAVPANKADRTEKYFCPCCQAGVVLKNGALRIPHYAHQTLTECQGASEGETPEHLQLKLHFKHWGDLYQQNFVLEETIPQISQRPDLLFEKVAVEIQCSSLNAKRLAERRAGYQKAGYEDWWLLGGKLQHTKRLHFLQKRFVEYQMGQGNYLWYVDLKGRRIILLSQLETDFTGKVFANLSYCSFYTQPLTELFALPEKKLQTKTHYHQKNHWLIHYPRYLQKALWQKQSQILALQAEFYQQQTHLCYLDTWCYLPTRFYLYFGDEILPLRFLFQKLKPNQFFEDYYQEVQRLKKSSWLFPLISEKQVLSDFYQECQVICQRLSLFK